VQIELSVEIVLFRLASEITKLREVTIYHDDFSVELLLAVWDKNSA
jgi:hypothetical protein